MPEKTEKPRGGWHDWLSVLISSAALATSLFSYRLSSNANEAGIRAKEESTTPRIAVNDIKLNDKRPTITFRVQNMGALDLRSVRIAAAYRIRVWYDLAGGPHSGPPVPDDTLHPWIPFEGDHHENALQLVSGDLVERSETVVSEKLPEARLGDKKLELRVWVEATDSEGRKVQPCSEFRYDVGLDRFLRTRDCTAPSRG